MSWRLIRLLEAILKFQSRFGLVFEQVMNVDEEARSICLRFYKGNTIIVDFKEHNGNITAEIKVYHIFDTFKTVCKYIRGVWVTEWEMKLKRGKGEK